MFVVILILTVITVILTIIGLALVLKTRSCTDPKVLVECNGMKRAGQIILLISIVLFVIIIGLFGYWLYSNRPEKPESLTRQDLLSSENGDGNENIDNIKVDIINNDNDRDNNEDDTIKQVRIDDNPPVVLDDIRNNPQEYTTWSSDQNSMEKNNIDNVSTVKYATDVRNYQPYDDNSVL